MALVTVKCHGKRKVTKMFSKYVSQHRILKAINFTAVQAANILIGSGGRPE